MKTAQRTCIWGVLVLCSFLTLTVAFHDLPKLDDVKIHPKLEVIHKTSEDTPLKRGSPTYKLWKTLPVHETLSVFIYNITNAADFMDGQKPIFEELGPFVYKETWEKVNIEEHGNGSISYNLKRTYVFDEENSAGSDSDLVVVPNIPLLSETSRSKQASRTFRRAMAALLNLRKIEPLVTVSIKGLLWGYDDPLIQWANMVASKEERFPFNQFGLFYGKNGTDDDVYTVRDGRVDPSELNMIESINGQSHLTQWKTEKCNSIQGSDGSLFPPNVDKTSTLYIFEKDLCRVLPLKFSEEIETSTGISAYRFTPPENVFDDVGRNPENECFCQSESTCAPRGLFDVSMCMNNILQTPMMMSFPHLYLADPKLSEQFEGISAPDNEKNRFYIDIHPGTGVTLGAKRRLQMNLAVSHVSDIKQVATVSDMILPIMWFEEGATELPNGVTALL